MTKLTNALAANQYQNLHDGLSDMIEGGRLSRDMIPDDYDWLVARLELCAAVESAHPFPRIKMTCGTCGSENVRRDASCVWSVEAQAWELVEVFDNSDCDECCGETHIETVVIAKDAADV